MAGIVVRCIVVRMIGQEIRPGDPELTLGSRVHLARKRAGLGQQQLAEALGVSRPQVSKWERDLVLPDVDEAKRMAELFEVSFGWLCGVAARNRWHAA